MNKLSKFLTATIIFASVGFLQAANARESFYNLNTDQPSVITNLGALNSLEQPVYNPPPAAEKPARTRKYSYAKPAKRAPVVKTLPVVSENTEPAPSAAPAPAPVAPLKRLPHSAPPVPPSPDFTSESPHLMPPPPAAPSVAPVKHVDAAPTLPSPPPVPPAAPPKVEEPVKTLPKPAPVMPEPPAPPLKTVASPPVSLTNLPPPLPPAAAPKFTPPVMPEPPTPMRNIAPPPSLPPANISAPVAMPDLPPPPPLPTSSSNTAPGPKVIVSSKSTPQIPAAPVVKTTDNIVALPPAPPAPPMKSVANKTLVAASSNLPAPPSLSSNDMLTLPPPLPPSAPVDIDQKIADEKAKINAEEIKSKAAIKAATAKMPTPKDIAASTPNVTTLPDLPPPPPPLDNSLPPLPMAKTDAAPVSKTMTKPSDLPPLDSLMSKNLAPAKTPDTGASSIPSKETVMVQPNKLPATNGEAGTVTMSYSEAETDVPLVEKSKLDNIISQLDADKTKTVTLIAYASGTPEQASQAKRTSLARVLAVRKYMMERNIDPDRINPRPLGNKAEGGVPDRVDMILEKGART